MQMKKKLIEEKASMAVYVAVVLVSFMIVLSAMYFSSTSVRKSQLTTVLKIKEAYESNIPNAERIYQTQLAKNKPVEPEEKEFTFDYTGAAQTFTIPVDGVYQLQVWGAEGGTNTGNSTAIAGKGGYSTGNVFLEKGTELHIYVGGQGGSASATCGGFNGGGISAGIKTNITNASGGGGGTDIRIGEDSLYARVIVAGGGGGQGTTSGSGGEGRRRVWNRWKRNCG